MFLKKLKKVTVLRAAALLLAAAFAMVVVACLGDGIAAGGMRKDNRQTPIADDFIISGLSAIYDGDEKEVSITPKEGKSTGTIAIFYEGTSGTVFEKSTDGPSGIGSYAVTFSVMATTEWKPATGLSAGTLEITEQSIYALIPRLDDFTITGLSHDYDANPKAVNITPDDGKSQGHITIHYEGTGGTTYPKSSHAPHEIGEYTVTFDVEAAFGWLAATKFSAGTLIIRGTPAADDYEIDSDCLNQLSNNIKTVNITPKEGKSSGLVTIKYDNSTTLPSSAGIYAVTFDVAEAEPWKAANGLSAGDLIIGDPSLSTPHADDYNISNNLTQQAGSVTAITVTKKDDAKSPGMVTVYYAGTGGTRSTELPSQPGQYAVTFDVAEASGWNPASALTAGTLTIKGTPKAEDYYFDGLDQEQILDNFEGISITPVDHNKSTGGIEGITVLYNNSPTLPSTVGNYPVTFNVAAVEPIWNAATGLIAGTLTITGVPKAGDYDVSNNLNQTVGSVTAVTVTAKAGKSNGGITVKYNNLTTLPTTAGTYPVTFDVAAAGFWQAASGLSAGTLTITAVAVVEPTINYGQTLSWGTTYTPTTLGLTPGNTTAEVRVAWYRGSGTGTGTVTKVRFIRGTLIAGKQLIEVTGSVAGSSSTAQHKAAVTGLMPGESYVYSVSTDGSNWSPMYDFKVPAATGPFKFAVITDPQIKSGGNVDSDSRYPATNVTTAAGWKETMDIISTKGVSLIVSAGDQVDTSTSIVEIEYTSLFAPDGIKNLPFAPVIGNHDTANSGSGFFQHYNIPNEQGTANSASAGANYYYLYNNILFVGLNTGGSSPTSRSAGTTLVNSFRTTIQNAKKAHPNYDWLIVHHHKSTASVGDHCADTDIQYYVEGGFETLMSDEKVDFVLAGHDHVYARSYPLQGLKDGQVSMPDKSAGITNTYTNPGNPIYLTFTTGSGLKYYAVSFDPYFKYASTLYVKTNANYPYLGDVTGAGTGSTAKGSTSYMTGNYRIVSNAVFVQSYIPSYTIVEVNGKTIRFSTYPIASRSGQNSGAAQAYSFDKDIPYDWVEITKD